MGVGAAPPRRRGHAATFGRRRWLWIGGEEATRWSSFGRVGPQRRPGLSSRPNGAARQMASLVLSSQSSP
jgi:hypothetical protein